mgnify:CR=1 FL=1
MSLASEIQGHGDDDDDYDEHDHDHDHDDDDVDDDDDDDDDDHDHDHIPCDQIDDIPIVPKRKRLEGLQDKDHLVLHVHTIM